MKLADGARRLAIFAYYDPDGRVDAYVPYLLRAMRPFCARQVVVVNGFLTPEAQDTLAACTDEVVLRPNRGYDVTAYKEAFLSIPDLSAYDEILFYNQTIFGPVCPLDRMFRDMGARDVDFWGLTRHKGADRASWDENADIPVHVQSFFFAVRASLFCQQAFRAYWEQLPEIETYWDAVGKHEVRFTRHFADQGYVWDVYVHTEDLETYNDYPLMGMPVTLLKERGCPFCKRKNFITTRHTYTTVPQGLATRQLYEYLRDETDYPTALIVENLTRTAPAADVTKALGLVWDTAHTPPDEADCAAVLNMTGTELMPLLVHAAKAWPAGMPVYVLCAGEEVRRAASAALPRATCRTIGGRGPQEMFGALWPQLAAHEFLLYLSDDLPLLLGQFSDATALQTAAEALRPGPCAALLHKDANVGLILPLMPSHQETLTLGLNLPEAADRLTEVLRSTGVQVPVGTGAGIASRGGMFFARTAALAPLAGAVLPDELFTGLYPDWEFVPALAAQGAGKLTAFAALPEQAFNELLNKNSMLEEIERLWATPRKMRFDLIEFRMKGIQDFYYERRYQMTLQQAFSAPLTAKQKLWICLQILMKPETFQTLRRLLHKRDEPAVPPRDDLD